MNRFFHLFVTVFDWTRVFTNRKSEIDWKEIGHMRARLVRMRFEQQPAEEIPTALSIGAMKASFRNLSSKDRDVRGLKHWYKGKEERKVVEEKALRERLYHSEKAHRERQESGQYPAIDLEALNKIQEVTYEVDPALDAEAKAKLERFLNGSVDNVNDLLFTPTQHSVEETKSELAASIDEVEFTEVISCEPDTTPTSSMDVVAKLEGTIKLDAIAPDEGLTPVSLPASHFVESAAAKAEESEEDSFSLRLVRTAKVTPLRGRGRKSM